MNDKIILIGKMNSSLENRDALIDDSVKPKKGQLGFVDKSFITSGEEGFNIAKVRIREERIPAIGDKMASRAGQKGTLGLIIPEEDMPFTEDGLRPDLIINPHALPSRMTIGQIVESLFGKVCTSYGAFGECTAFQIKGSNFTTYAPLLVKAGFHSSGNQILYNGMSGDQLEADIYLGPTYYMRLKHMVKDKINYRARGPNTALTRQPVQGRANDGGLRIGEMERDGVLAHGMSYFLNESFLVRGDEYYMAVCNKTGSIAIYNEAKNLFISPYADGPLEFIINPDDTMNIKNLTRFGRSFSILRIPYAFKLLIHELLTLNVKMSIITEDNIDQLLPMAFSNNVGKLLNEKADTDDELKRTLDKYASQIRLSLSQKNRVVAPVEDVQDMVPEPIEISSFEEAEERKELEKEREKEREQGLEQLGEPDLGQLREPEYATDSPAFVPSTPLSGNTVSPPYIPSGGAFQSGLQTGLQTGLHTGLQAGLQIGGTMGSPTAASYSSAETYPSAKPQSSEPESTFRPIKFIGSEEPMKISSTILDVPEEKENNDAEKEKERGSKSVSFETTSDSSSSSSETKKIINL